MRGFRARDTRMLRRTQAGTSSSQLPPVDEMRIEGCLTVAGELQTEVGNGSKDDVCVIYLSFLTSVNFCDHIKNLMQKKRNTLLKI